ncbi:MAG: hypothetical protein HN550_06440 [Deltaproteobacteria bacterium]|nr:hypothetical protein [Deltaproteobacteria bacterium]
MVDIKSGTPGIVYLWNLNNMLPEQRLVTPELLGVSWQDKDGNYVESETDLSFLILQGNVSNVNDVRDVYVYLNNKKVFYSLNRNSGQQYKNTEFHFQTKVNLDTGNNQISIFSRSHSGFTSERRLRIFRK